MNKDKQLKIVVMVLLIILLGIFIVKISPVVFQNDTFYDIKLGERYIKTGMFKIDDYSIHPGLVYQTHHYLVCIIEYLVYSLFSFKGLYILEIILASIIGLLFYLVNKTLLKNKSIMYLLIFLQILSLSTFISLRAQMYSYIIFLLEILFVEKFLNTNKKRYSAFIAILPLLLINFHSGSIYFYFIIVFTYLLNSLNINFWRIESDKRMGGKQIKNIVIASLIGLFLTLINPYGLDGITYGLKTLESYYITNHISEFAQFSLHGTLGYLITGYVFICAFCMLFSKQKIKMHELLLLLGTTLMTFTSIRHFSLLIITSVVLTPHLEALYKSIDLRKRSLLVSLKKGITYMNIIIFVLYVFAFSHLTHDVIAKPKNHTPNNRYPIDAVKYIKNNIDSKAHIFNEYSWGSYLMFNDILVFIDSRCDLYNEEYNKGATVFKDYINVTYNNISFEYIVSKYDIDYFLINRSSPLANKMIKNPNNVIIYSDKLSILIKV